MPQPENQTPPAQLAEQLTITGHALSNFKERAKMFSVVGAVDEIRRLFALAKFCGKQLKQKGHSPGKPRRGRNNSPVVDVYQANDLARGVQWTFFIRNGKVLLTAHDHDLDLDEPEPRPALVNVN